MALTLKPTPGRPSEPTHVSLPASTRWPIALALGLALVATGLVTTKKVSWVGAALAVAGSAGWCLQVLPHDRHDEVPVAPAPVPIATSRRKVSRIAATEVRHRARLPLEIYPISAGLKGGLAGGVAMAALAMLYGLLSHRSIWYPINLLGAVVYERVQVSTTQIEAFHTELLLVAMALHLTTSVLVGLLYGALLPMLPRHPILLGGVLAPLVWTGLLYNVLDIIDPILNQRIQWGWFLASQVAFGVVAGLVVLRQVRIPTWQYPLAARAGLETPGMMDDEEDKNRP